MTCWDSHVTSLHEQRLQAVLWTLIDCRAQTVLDLGCGRGALLERLVELPQLQTIVGLDLSGESLLQARQALQPHLEASPARLALVQGSYLERRSELRGFDACSMVETIEHVEPRKLSQVEHAVFGFYRPATVVMTTPNYEFNARLGLAHDERRHPDHQFEWDRIKFRGWARGIASRRGYTVSFQGVGDYDPLLGHPTQMAVFRRQAASPEV